MVMARSVVTVLATLFASARPASGFGLGTSWARVRTASSARHAAEAMAKPASDITHGWGGYGSERYCRRCIRPRGWLCTAAMASSIGPSSWSPAPQRYGLERICNRRGVALASSRGGRRAAADTNFVPPTDMKPQISEDLPVGEMSEDPTLEEVLTACKAADERKAGNVVALRVAQLTAVTEYMVVLEGNSRPQNQAIAQNIEEKMMEVHGREAKIEGAPESGWIVLDFGNIIVHIMTPKSRGYYDLESFWGNGTPVPLEGVLTPNVVAPEKAAAEEEVDPFWS